MNNIFKANRAFTPQLVRILAIATLILTAGATAFFAVIAPPVGAVLIPIVISIIESLMDYGRYAGVSSRKSAAMGLVRSSSCGCRALTDALIGDEAATFIRLALEAGIPSVVFYLCMGEFPVYAALIAGFEITLVLYVLEQLVRIITRPLTLLMSIYFILQMFIIWAADIGIGVLILFNFEAQSTEEMVGIALIVIAAALVIGAILSILNVKLNVRGFRVGYRDSDAE